MAQLVFVHGVATRDTPEYRASVANRDKLFQKLLFAGSAATIHSAMWGDFVPKIDQKVFQTDQGATTYSINVAETRSFGGGLGGGFGGDEGAVTIGAIGQQDPVAALDAICSEIADRAEREARSLTSSELEAFKRATDAMMSDTARGMFADGVGSSAIAARLTEGAPGEFSLVSSVADAVTAVTDRVRNAVSTLGFSAVRGKLSPTVGLFLGDVFVYLKEGAVRQKIRDEIARALTAAQSAAAEGGGPLIVVGHSMGGVILVDMLSDPDAAQLPKSLSVDALLTVGSQPGLFASLDLLAQAPDGEPSRQRPACVKHWFNIFDPIDPLAFRTDMIFAGAEDFIFNSVTGLTEAHSKYFQRPQFFARSRKRLQELNVL